MSTPLRELITSIAFDEPSRAAFSADPTGFLEDHGWSGLDGVDVSTALGALVGELPIDQADALHSVALNADGFGADLDGAILGLDAAASALGDHTSGHDDVDDPADGIDGFMVDAASDPAGLDADVEDPALSLDDEAAALRGDAAEADSHDADVENASPPDVGSAPTSSAPPPLTETAAAGPGDAADEAHDPLEDLDGEPWTGDLFPDVDDRSALEGVDDTGDTGDTDDSDDAGDFGLGEF